MTDKTAHSWWTVVVQWSRQPITNGSVLRMAFWGYCMFGMLNLIAKAFG